MKMLLRWWRFNLVGAMGAAVQLVALGLLRRITGGHYLCASAVAMELALLHNFVWHLHYTWRERRASWPRQLARFQLANGMVSLAGNLALMRLLVREGHLPLLVANLIAILCCSVVNFRLGDQWAFGREGEEKATAKYGDSGCAGMTTL